MDGIIINGQKVVIPGVTSIINASELAGRGPGGRGYLAFLYEAERGGEPKVPYIYTSPAILKRYLPARLAAILGKLAFAPSTDTDRVPTGAQALVMVRVNPAVQASLQLVDAADVACIDVDAKDWGNYGNDISVTVAEGTTSGRKITVTYGAVTETFDNVGDMEAFTATYTAAGIPAGATIQSVLAYLDPLAASPAPSFYVNVVLRVVGGTAAFNPSAWMAFDGNQHEASGKLEFTFVDQDGDKNIIITGTRKDTGAAVVDTITVHDGETTATSTYAFSEITSINVAALTGDVDIAFSAFNLIGTSYATISAVVDRINNVGRGFEAAFDTTRTTLAITNMDYDLGTGGAGNSIVAGHTFNAHVHHILDNVASNFVALSRSATARNLPKVQGPTNLTGGSTGTATTGVAGDWDQGLAAIKEVAVSHVCAGTGEKAVHSLINTHINFMNGEGRDERIAFLGCPAGTGKTTADIGLYARTAALNYRNVSFCPQEVKIYDENGAELWVEPYYTAVLAAACDAGRPTTDSITWATVDVLGFRDQPNHGSSPWSVRDDKAELITHGLCLLEQRQGTSLIQWTRDVSTHQTDDNPIFCSIFANEGVNLSNKALRRRLESKIGRGSVVVTAGSVRNMALKELRRQKEAGEIKDYLASSVVVEDLGNGFLVDYRLAPAEAIYWIQSTAYIARMPTNA